MPRASRAVGLIEIDVAAAHPGPRSAAATRSEAVIRLLRCLPPPADETWREAASVAEPLPWPASVPAVFCEERDEGLCNMVAADTSRLAHELRVEVRRFQHELKLVRPST